MSRSSPLPHRPAAVAILGVALLLGLVASAHAASTERVSVSPSGEQGNGHSGGSSRVALSADGRFVAFSSEASNLVTGDDNHASDVFVRDRLARSTSLVSVSSSGEQGDDESTSVAMSDDGRFVAFVSRARNLTPGRARRSSGVFLRDREAGTTIRVDPAPGAETQGGASGQLSMSADGRFVVFASYDQLVPSDTDGRPDVFRYDSTTGTITSPSAALVEPPDLARDARPGDISAEGRLVAFMAGLDSADLYVYDHLDGTIEKVAENAGDSSNGASVVMARDGSVIAFQRGADLHMVDVLAGTTACAICWTGRGSATWTQASDLSSDGRQVAFASLASRLVPRDRNRMADAFVKDTRTRAVVRLSVSRRGGAANGPSGIGGMSADGRFVAFASDASNLVARDTNSRTDIFVRGPLADPAAR